ncbi:MAG: hypothetical protein LBL74_04575 [Bacteroidales bacterium]|nr:hypothetical protein [Bacteroidales bacterium]
MKKIIYTIIVIFIGFEYVNAQNNAVITVFINQDNTKIPIYTSPQCDKESYSIFQDSIFEHFFWIEIIGESALTFEVKIGSASQDNSPIINGWIEKKYCGVFLSSGRNIKIFETVNENSPYEQFVLENDILANVVNICLDGRGFIKVIFRIKDRYYEGWVKDYCGSIYNSCN